MKQHTYLPIPFCFGPLKQAVHEHMGGRDHVTLQQQGLDPVHVVVHLHRDDVTTLHYKQKETVASCIKHSLCGGIHTGPVR